ncbi:alpha/beta hydrolase fold domain-containing protein [Aeromicrobium duanguangcaii]|uniref:Alpha/beta hydrolase n=1 Tax=Aeromicrobium duanguangcaii TaxID=2968086 RepID=A0ABY5KFL7_9ACTN|nr:alpha/beta hydrolase fold domain-containing protein [Aeromicrobium duanguangcaii]MCD9153650.1 alpha/beta hydrolase [Aeromicrobium duanguangcaii]MCL3836365.1 alpha/beta hydrolase [Aeromicrobium duanguangcaii]UUI69267.1 alpha/beta hydrolase [Aeromicrobium duanguangcaii]
MSVPKPLVRTRLLMARPVMHSARVSLGAKRTMADSMAGASRAPEGAIYDFDVIAGLPVQFVTVEGTGPATGRATMIYLHGGGHVVGSSRAYRAFAAHLAMHSGMDVLLPEYPLAPESPYPAALDSLIALYRALPSYGVDPTTVVLAGDDAGAGLALAMALEIRDHGLPMPAAIGMISPWLDMSADIERARPSASDPWFTPALATRWARTYLGGADPRDPGASPLHGDFDSLPPIVVHYSGLDPLHTDAEAFLQKVTAKADGPRVIAREYPDMWHSFHLQAGRLEAADEAVEEFGTAVASLVQIPGRHGDVVPINRPVAGQGGRELRLVRQVAAAGTPSV